MVDDNQTKGSRNRDICLYTKPSSGSDTSKLVLLILIGVSLLLNFIFNIRLVHIDQNHSSYDPLHYVLLHPFGEPGWSYETYVKVNKQVRNGAKDKFVTAMEFYSFRLMDRELSTIQLFGRLYHEYIVDMWAKIEQLRLNYLKFNQDKLRTEVYHGLADNVTANDCTVGKDCGRRIILPSTFIGSPRYMHQLFQDAMSVVRELGKPDLFITMTCNPTWPEIVEALKPGQQPCDRPDIIARVFNMKFRELMTDITKNQIFGKVLAKVHVIEFQKRGLPHAHILLILDAKYKPRTSLDIDKIVSAEIPDPHINKQAYETVTKFMMHGPCGLVNSNAPCMNDNKCSKDYPKQFSDETLSNLNG